MLITRWPRFLQLGYSVVPLPSISPALRRNSFSGTQVPSLCPTIQETLGLMIPTPRKSQDGCIFRRRGNSSGCSSPRYRTVRRLYSSSFVLADCSIRCPGIIIFMFFQCMSALLDPTRRKERGVKWPLIVHTAAMFSFTTVFIVTTIYVHINDSIDNRNFPGDDVFPPGPFGYLLSNPDAVYLVSLVPLVLNSWFGDGLLVCPVPVFTD